MYRVVQILDKLTQFTPQNEKIVEHIINSFGLDKIAQLLKGQKDLYFYMFMRKLNDDKAHQLVVKASTLTENPSDDLIHELDKLVNTALEGIEPPSSDPESDVIRHYTKGQGNSPEGEND
jgi:hypothetical protein